jgi:hypothetical protein
LTVAFNRAKASWHPASSDLINQVRISDVRQDSDFRTKIALRKKSCFSAVLPCVRRTSGDFTTPQHFLIRSSNI